MATITINGVTLDLLSEKGGDGQQQRAWMLWCIKPEK